MEIRNITFIGAGNMAGSIIGGLIANGYPKDAITATTRSQESAEKASQTYGIRLLTDNVEALERAEVVVLAVKPQMMEEVCQQMIDAAGGPGDRLYISVAAGLSCDRLQSFLGGTSRIVRCMPNTPSLLQLGMAGLFAPETVGQTDRLFSQQITDAVGKSVWVEKETEINHIIAAAGSAPAYFFLFMEAIQKTAEQLGFSQETARTLVQQTALGAANMVEHHPELSLETLRAQVTSKGGTTAEAIKTFEQEHLGDVVNKAMHAAINRAIEMEKLF